MTTTDRFGNNLMINELKTVGTTDALPSGRWHYSFTQIFGSLTPGGGKKGAAAICSGVRGRKVSPGTPGIGPGTKDKRCWVNYN